MHMREREGGGHLHRSGMKTGLSLCLEKVNNEKMEGIVWNEVSWGVVEVQEIQMRGWFPRELGRETEEGELFGSLSMTLK